MNLEFRALNTGCWNLRLKPFFAVHLKSFLQTGTVPIEKSTREQPTRWAEEDLHSSITSKSGTFADISLQSVASSQQMFPCKSPTFHLDRLSGVFLEAYTHLCWFGKEFTVFFFSNCCLFHLAVFFQKSGLLMSWISIQTTTVHARTDPMSHPWWVNDTSD